MINPAAMLGLDNVPAYDNLKQINKGIETLIQHKTRDYVSERKHFKEQQEQDKRERQDLKFIQDKEAKEVIKFQKFMKSKDGGLTAALLGGAALLGALSLVAALDIPKMVMTIFEKLMEWIKSPFTQDDVDDVQEAAENPPATGDVSAMEPAEDQPGGAGSPLAIPPGISKGSPPGMRRDPHTGGWKMHNGWDMPAPVGTPLTIKGNGKVVDSGTQGATTGYGNWITIKDSRGEHFYAHLSKMGKYKKGDSIKTGDVVAYTGNSGRSTGPHLHWEFDTATDKAGFHRSKKRVESMDPLKHGYKWTTPFTGLQTGGAVDKKGKKDRWGINIGPGYTGMSNLTKKTTGSVADKTAKPPYGEKHIASYMDKGGIKDKNERAMFMAQMAHESGNFKYHTELKPKPEYEGKEGLANLQKGDGLRYLGRGYIQLTGRWNYDNLRKKTGLPLVSHPEKAAEADNAGKIALKYWQDPKRESMRVAARKGDVKGATYMINENYHNLDDRIAKFKKYQANPMQRGGVVGYQGGGMVNLASRRIPSPNQNFYDTNFFMRQGKKGRSSTIIVVNRSSSSAGGSSSAGNSATDAPFTGTPINYTDISQTYYRYIRGIRS